MLSQKPLTPAIEESRRVTGKVFLDKYMLDLRSLCEVTTGVPSPANASASGLG